MLSSTEQDIIVGVSDRRYQRGYAIGQGAFGKVNIVTQLDGSKRQFVCKSEDFTDQFCSLMYEAWVIKVFADHVNSLKREIQCLYIRDVEYTTHTFSIIMDMGGQSIAKWIEQYGNISDTKYTKLNLMFLTITMRSLMLLRELHSLGFVHRDIKPANMTLKSIEQGFQVYLIDFGLAQRFDPNRIQLSPTRMGFVGTLMFASRAAHQKLPQTPRDDVESLAYTLLYMYSTIPWRGYPIGQDRYEQFSAQKEKFFDAVYRGVIHTHPIIDDLVKDLYDMNTRQTAFDYQKHIDTILEHIRDIEQKIENPYKFKQTSH